MCVMQDLKKAQAKMKITGAQFLATAPPIKVDICGNILTVRIGPRECE